MGMLSLFNFSILNISLSIQVLFSSSAWKALVDALFNFTRKEPKMTF